MELGRECLALWGYKRVDELIWVKTNQLQRLIRTGRTGHWLNHSKEHCLVGVKGCPQINRNLDCDVLVSEVCLGDVVLSVIWWPNLSVVGMLHSAPTSLSHLCVKAKVVSKGCVGAVSHVQH